MDPGLRFGLGVGLKVEIEAGREVAVVVGETGVALVAVEVAIEAA